jgi:hypothetical protein
MATIGDVLTKKDLEERFNISDNTAYKTLKACGLDTSKTHYTNEEIEGRFVPARAILDGNGTYKDVENYFRMKDSKASSKGYSSGLEQPETPSNADGFMEVVQDEVTDSINQMVKAAVSDIIPYIPRMTAAAIAEAARSGKIREAFARFRNDFVAGHKPSGFNGFGSVIEVPVVGLGGGVTESPDSKDVQDGATSKVANDFPEFVTDIPSDSDVDSLNTNT